MKIFQTTSMKKFLKEGNVQCEEFKSFSALNNERFAYQIVLENEKDEMIDVKIEITSPLKPYITVERADYAYINSVTEKDYDTDDGYFTVENGFVFDPLIPVKDNTVTIDKESKLPLFITVDLCDKVPQAKYPIKVSFTFDETTQTKTFELEVIGAYLSDKKFMYTNWFYCDAIAQTYDVPVFSEKFWELTEKFMLAANHIGMNVIFTPIITPPLDTEIGGERLTVQLIDIEKNGEKYTFEFSKLHRWIALAKKCGMKYFEIAHLFTQWGAKCTPKIVVKENGEEKKLFGWHVPALDESYAEFLRQLLPELVKVLKKNRIAKNTFFHISDEPRGGAHLEQYKKCKALVKPYIDGITIMDALSNPEYYISGAVDCPVPATTSVHSFMNLRMKERWAYYCCSHHNNASNRFMAQYGWNTRVLGIQMFKYDIAGFLHWGYNHYYTRLAKELINPYVKNDLNNYPSGDAFIVYPGEDGPLYCVRSHNFYDALQDMRALWTLSEYIGKENVIRLIEDEAGMEIKFDNFPKNEEFILSLRNKVNALIKEHVIQE